MANGRMSSLWVSGTATMGIFQVVLLLRLQTHQMVGQFSNETYTIFNADILLNEETREARKEIAPADLSIKMKPVSALPIVQIVSCEMLATCWNFQPSGPAQCTGICCYGTARGSCYRSPLLHAFNEVDCIRARESGVFPWGFLHPSPPRITNDVDHRRPVSQATYSSVVKCPCFRRHSLHAPNRIQKQILDKLSGRKSRDSQH